jgi:predicted metal-dependent hydrolase
MHRRQPNHSAKFWNEVGHVCPEWRDAERWLRKNGRDYL